jgi:predicted O-methyltransferase YrrM
VTDIVDPAVEAYAEAHTTPPPTHLAAVADKTRAHGDLGDFAGMMVGTLEGRFLEMLVFGLGARRVLEIGTFTGYSSISMAAGLPAGGRITTCELSPVCAAEARENIAASPYADRIEIVEGPAIDTVAGLRGPFDLVFIDADKAGYAAYFEAVLPKLAPGGVIAVDNTLWHGSVVDAGDTSTDALAIRAFNDALAADRRVVCVQLTVRDGVTLVRRADDPGLARAG